MKRALIEAIAAMSEADAITLWEILSGIAEDQDEHCSLLAERGEQSDAELRVLLVSERIMHAGNSAMAALADVSACVCGNEADPHRGTCDACHVDVLGG